MATRDSNGAERSRSRLDGNRLRTHPKHSGRKAVDALDRLSPAQTGRPTTGARVAGPKGIGGEP
jgi:hypothetical protein